jgi:hypothetical protein
MDAMIPDLLNLKAQLTYDSLNRHVAQMRELWQRVGLPIFATFKSPTSGPSLPLADFDLEALAERQVRFEASDGTFLSVSAPPNLSGTLIQAVYPLKGDEARCRRALRTITELLRELFATGELEEGTVRRVGKPLEAVPLTPVGQGYVALVTTNTAVDAAYWEPSAFWDAWDHHEQAGGRHLLARGIQAATSAELFRAVFEKEWAMARAARPGQTRFGTRHAPPGCEGLLMAGKSCLREVGERDGHVEVAGFVPEAAHIPPWEILSWNEILLRGRRDDGSLVSSLRVVFRDERMTRAEGTPLLDIGAQVVFLGRDGRYQTLA